MTYGVRFKPRALKDLENLPLSTRRRILAKIETLETDLRGDVKRLTNYTPEYRLRVGDHRVLFEIEGSTIIVSGIVQKPTDREDIMTIHKVQTIGKNGRKEFAVLPYADYLKLQAELDDYEDLRCLREAHDAEAAAPTIGLPEAKQLLLKRTPTRSANGKPRR